MAPSSAVVGELEHRGVGLLGPAHGARLHHRVVLLEQRPARAEVGRAEQREQHLGRVLGGERARRAPGRSGSSGSAGSRSYSGQSSTSASTGMSPTTSSPSSTRSRRESVTSPIAVERTSQRSQISWSSASFAGLDHAQHPLLGLRDHDLERLHVVLAQRHLRHVDVEARPRPWTPSPTRRTTARRRRGPAARRACRARAARGSTPCSLLLLERVADLHRRPLGGVVLVELRGGQHRRAADAVAARCARPSAPAGCPRPAAALRIRRSSRAMPRHIALTRQFCS